MKIELSRTDPADFIPPAASPGQGRGHEGGGQRPAVRALVSTVLGSGSRSLTAYRDETISQTESSFLTVQRRR